MTDLPVVDLPCPPWAEAHPTDAPDYTQAWGRWPCPASNRPGGIGGSALTACGVCGTMMANTAGGPHTGHVWAPIIAQGGHWDHNPNLWTPDGHRLPEPADGDDLTPTEYLVLDVMSSRRRLGEGLWTFPRFMQRTLRSLEAKGYIGWKQGPSGDPQAWFNRLRPDLTEPWTRHRIEYRRHPLPLPIEVVEARPYGSFLEGLLDHVRNLATLHPNDTALPLVILMVEHAYQENKDG